MSCPFHDGDDEEGSESEAEMTPPEDRGVDRREFMKSALVIGGASALSTITGLYGMPGTAAASDDSIGIGDRDNRQHAWDAFEVNARGTTVPPSHHVLLALDYQGHGEPSAGHRRQAERAFDQLEAAFEWGHEGLLFTVGYSASYFARFDEDLPEGLDPDDGAGLLRSETTVEATAASHEDPTADSYDAVVHMASDHVQNLLAAEAALWGDRDEINDVEIEATLDGVFERPADYPERRVGFAGHDNISENLEADTDFDADRIPEASDLSMGFNPLYRNSVPRETNATIVEDQKLVEPKPPGVFAQGSIQHVSKLDIDLDLWYDHHDEEGRRERMLSPHHSDDEVGVAGEELGESTGTEDEAMRNADAETDLARRVQEDAESGGPVGHAQKLSRARFDVESRLTEDAQGNPTEERDDDLTAHDDEQGLETVMLRRDIDSTDQGTPGMHFVALMRFNGYMTYMRQAMNGVEFDTAAFALDGDDRIAHESVDVDDQDDGIVNYLETQRRGNFLVPPLTLRALPHPQSEDVSITVSEGDDEYVVEVDGVGRGEIDEDTARFGWYREVNCGRGARPSRVSNRGGTLTLAFPVDETGVDDAPVDEPRVRLFAKRRSSGRPVRGTSDLGDVQERETGREREENERESDARDGDDGESAEREEQESEDNGRSGNGGNDNGQSGRGENGNGRK